MIYQTPLRFMVSGRKGFHTTLTKDKSTLKSNQTTLKVICSTLIKHNSTLKKILPTLLKIKTCKMFKFNEEKRFGVGGKGFRGFEKSLLSN